MRLIDADVLIDFIDLGHLRSPSEICFSEFDVVDMLEDCATVDAVEVVRCGECKYYIYQWKSDDEKVYGLCGIHGTADLKSTDYCSYGERKEVSE